MDKKRTIKAPGSNISRVSVACDRCRKKKIRCFYDDNGGEVCANCKNVGLECIFTDKLARKAFPRGYTESLEERVRVLEYENKKLQKMIELRGGDMKEEKVSELNFENILKLGESGGNGGVCGSGGGSGIINNNHTHIHNEECNCGMNGDTVINRPVSIAGSVDIDNGYLSDNGSLLSLNVGVREGIEIEDEEEEYKSPDNMFFYKPHSFEQVNAPGAVAAINLQRKLQRKNFLNLANLIAAAVPRSTEETLYLPTLLAKIVEIHGFKSDAPYLTARTIALLKQAYKEEERYKIYSVKFSNIEFNNISNKESFKFFEELNLPNKINLELCIEVYFKTWNNIIPVLDRVEFMKEYEKFKDNGINFMKGNEKFGEILVIIVCLVVSKEGCDNSYEIIHYYDHIIKEMIKSNLNSNCCISSLRGILIELIYCLITDDLTVSYSLRGKMVTMCQQLRLHRCPAAVLGIKGDKVSKIQQGERRILFWCIYTVDVFAALVLGVPRLLKDEEIECALPSNRGNELNEENDIRFNNNFKLSLVGKVSKNALEMMRFSQILGSIIDTIFRRADGIDSNELAERAERRCVILESMLEEWRVRAGVEVGLGESEVEDSTLSLQYLYYLARGLIYMPLLSGSGGGGSGGGGSSGSGSSGTKSGGGSGNIGVQTATNALLRVWLRVVQGGQGHVDGQGEGQGHVGQAGHVLAVPFNAGRAAARHVLLVCGGALVHTRGGALFQQARTLAAAVVGELRRENAQGRLGCLSDACVRTLADAVDAILGPVPAAAGATAAGAAGAAAAPALTPAAAARARAAAVSPLRALNDIFADGDERSGGASRDARVEAACSRDTHTNTSAPGPVPGPELVTVPGGPVTVPAPATVPAVAGGLFEELVAVDASLGLPFLAFGGCELADEEPHVKRQRVGTGVAGVEPGSQEFALDLALDLDVDLDVDLDLDVEGGVEGGSGWGSGWVS